MQLSVRTALLLGAAVSLAGFTLTRSLFTDSEQSGKNVFVVGTLELSLDSGSGSQVERLEVADVGSEDKLSGSKRWFVKNVGTLPGTLFLSMENVRNFENGCNSPESLVDTSCGNPGEDEGELGGVLALTVTLDHTRETYSLPSFFATEAGATDLKEHWQASPANIVLPPNSTAAITLDWSLKNSDYANEIQSDSVLFDLIFELRQVRNTP